MWEEIAEQSQSPRTGSVIESYPVFVVVLLSDSGPIHPAQSQSSPSSSPERCVGRLQSVYDLSRKEKEKRKDERHTSPPLPSKDPRLQDIAFWNDLTLFHAHFVEFDLLQLQHIWRIPHRLGRPPLGRLMVDDYGLMCDVWCVQSAVQEESPVTQNRPWWWWDDENWCLLSSRSEEHRKGIVVQFIVWFSWASSKKGWLGHVWKPSSLLLKLLYLLTDHLVSNSWVHNYNAPLFLTNHLGYKSNNKDKVQYSRPLFIPFYHDMTAGTLPLSSYSSSTIPQLYPTNFSHLCPNCKFVTITMYSVQYSLCLYYFLGVSALEKWIHAKYHGLNRNCQYLPRHGIHKMDPSRNERHLYCLVLVLSL